MERSAIDILMAEELPLPREKKIKIKRLSNIFKEDFVLTLRELTYSKVADISKLEAEADIQILLTGVKEPVFKNPELLKKHNAQTPAELVKKLLSPGEIADIAREIERLSGFRVNTFEDFKKN